MDASVMILHSLHHQQTAYGYSACPTCLGEVAWSGWGYWCEKCQRVVTGAVQGWRTLPCPFPHLHE